MQYYSGTSYIADISSCNNNDEKMVRGNLGTGQIIHQIWSAKHLKWADWSDLTEHVSTFVLPDYEKQIRGILEETESLLYDSEQLDALCEQIDTLNTISKTIISTMNSILPYPFHMTNLANINICIRDSESEEEKVTKNIYFGALSLIHAVGNDSAKTAIDKGQMGKVELALSYYMDALNFESKLQQIPNEETWKNFALELKDNIHETPERFPFIPHDTNKMLGDACTNYAENASFINRAEILEKMNNMLGIENKMSCRVLAKQTGDDVVLGINLAMYYYAGISCLNDIPSDKTNVEMMKYRLIDDAAIYHSMVHTIQSQFFVDWNQLGQKIDDLFLQNQDQKELLLTTLMKIDAIKNIPNQQTELYEKIKDLYDFSQAFIHGIINTLEKYPLDLTPIQQLNSFYSQQPMPSYEAMALLGYLASMNMQYAIGDDTVEEAILKGKKEQIDLAINIYTQFLSLLLALQGDLDEL